MIHFLFQAGLEQLRYQINSLGGQQQAPFWLLHFYRTDFDLGDEMVQLKKPQQWILADYKNDQCKKKPD